jgi:AraC family transcriptional regulator
MTDPVEDMTSGVPIRAWDGPDLSVAEACYAPGVCLVPHAHELSYVSLVLRGAGEERVGRDSALARSSSVVVMPTGVEHANRIGPGGLQCLVVALKSSFLSDLLPARGRPDRWRWFHGGPAARLMLRAYRECLLADDMSPCGLCENLLDLFGAIAGERDETTGPGPRCVAAAVEWLRARGTHGAPLGELSAELGKDPAYLARAFRRRMGCTMSEYRRRVRAREAADLLASTDAPLTHVALATGFADQSHLCRVFKAETGLTPQAYRLLAGKR